jgi:hypothetical protein
VGQSFTTRYKSELKIFILQLLSRFFITLYQQNKFEKYKASRITIDQFYRFKQKIAQADRSGSRKSWGMESRKKKGQARASVVTTLIATAKTSCNGSALQSGKPCTKDGV